MTYMFEVRKHHVRRSDVAVDVLDVNGERVATIYAAVRDGRHVLRVMTHKLGEVYEHPHGEVYAGGAVKTIDVELSDA